MLIRIKSYFLPVAITTLLSSWVGHSNNHISIPHQNQRRDVTQCQVMFEEQVGIGECSGSGFPNIQLKSWILALQPVLAPAILHHRGKASVAKLPSGLTDSRSVF